MKLLAEASTKTIDTVRFLIFHLLILIELALGLRWLLKFFLANPNTYIVEIIYRISDYLLFPFKSIFPNTHIGTHPVEISTLIAMAGYGLLVYVIFEFFNHLHESHY